MASGDRGGRSICLVAFLVASVWDLGVVTGVGVWVWVGREGRLRMAGPGVQPQRGSGPLVGTLQFCNSWRQG